MKKRKKRKPGPLDLRLVLAGFFASLCPILLMLELVYVNHHARQTGLADSRTLTEVQNTGRETTVRIVNAQFTIDWEAYENLEPLLQKMTVFLPGSLRAVTASFYGAAEAAGSFQTFPASAGDVTIGSTETGKGAP